MNFLIFWQWVVFIYFNYVNTLNISDSRSQRCLIKETWKAVQCQNGGGESGGELVESGGFQDGAREGW